MIEDRLDHLAVAARDELRRALDPTPPDIARVAHRVRGRRRAATGAIVAVVAVVAALPLVLRDGGEPATIVAGPGPDGVNADLLGPGESRPLATSPLAGRSTMAAVWTGSDMLIWGGDGPDGQLDDGAAYDPRQDTWRMLPQAPLTPRNAPAAVWTGDEMLLWGGASSGGGSSDGAAYDPTGNRWRPIPDAPFQSAGRPVGVWTGREMIVLAGFNSSEAGAYNPETDQWRTLPELPGHLQAPNPVAVWAGDRVVAVVQPAGSDPDAAPRIMSLAPGEDAWVDAPAVSQGNVVMAWTGNNLVAAAGRDALNLTEDGQRWERIATAPNGVGVGDTPAVWTGSQLLLWEGDTASVIDPGRRTWDTTRYGDTARRTQPAVVWADGVLLAWGGFPDHATGVIVRPTTDTPPRSNVSVPEPPVDGATLHSQPTLIDGIPTVVATFVYAEPHGGTTGRIDVLEWDGDWRTAASFEVTEPGVLAEAEPERPLLVQDVTGDGEADFVVPLEAAATAPYQVLSSHDGTWRQVPFGSPDRIVITEPDMPSAERFITSSNLCDPTCAAGRYERELWRYSSAQGRFVLTDSATCEAVARGEWICDPPDSPLAAGQPIGSG
jgi:hypothetical protein